MVAPDRVPSMSQIYLFDNSTVRKQMTDVLLEFFWLNSNTLKPFVS